MSDLQRWNGCHGFANRERFPTVNFLYQRSELFYRREICQVCQGSTTTFLDLKETCGDRKWLVKRVRNIAMACGVTRWGGKTIEVRARLVPQFLWTTASIEVFLGGDCILRTGGQAKLTGSHAGSFKDRGIEHPIELLNWGWSWGFYFPYQLFIDGARIASEDSKVQIDNCRMAFVPISLLVLLGSAVILALIFAT